MRALAGLLAAPACGACTMIGGLERFVPDEAEVHGVRLERFEPSHHLGGRGLRLGGSPGALRLETGEQRLRLHCHEYAWYQHWFGPILPVFPVPMGSGPYYPELALQLELEPGSAPVTLQLDAVRVLPGPLLDEHAPLRWSRRKFPGTPAEETRLEPGTALTLGPGEHVWLVYGIDNDSTPWFDVLLPQESGPLRLRFRRERTPFLFHAP